MKKIITGACIIVVYCFSACANMEESDDLSLTDTDSSKPATITPGSPSFLKPDTSLLRSGQATLAPLPQPVVNQVSSTTTAPGMNPPHGQLNHRCDIAVGAPLNSPVTKPGITTPAAPVQKTTTTTSSVITPPGMNPPHGQPNHRCDIAVGAPLNSPVIKPGTKTVSTAASGQKTTANTSSTTTAPGMNPPHGKPNHRCDIAVGAPLNSPVAKPPTQTVIPNLVPAPVIVPPKKDSGS